MEKKILFAVDGSEKGFKALSIVGDLVKDQSDVRLILFIACSSWRGSLRGKICTDVDESCKLPYATQEKVGMPFWMKRNGISLPPGFPKKESRPN
jgi:hypothetical protein